MVSAASSSDDLPTPSSAKSLEVSKEGWDMYTTFEQSMVSYPRHVDQLRVSMTYNTTMVCVCVCS